MSLVHICLLCISLLASSIQASSIRVATFNLENLFDLTHDPGHEDWTFLPLSAKATTSHKQKCQKIRSAKYRQECLSLDWSRDKLERKISRIAYILRKNAPKGLDVMVFTEVENTIVLKQLLKALDFKGLEHITLLPSGDRRGIHQAVVSRFPLAESAQIHKVAGLHRGILQAKLRGPGGLLIEVLAVHLPAPYHPMKKRQKGLQALQNLAQRSDAALVLAAGDFNIKAAEGHLYRGLARAWDVSHLKGCHSCSGTYLYKKHWSFLDALLVKKGRCELVADSIRLGEHDLVASDHRALFADVRCLR